MALHNTDSFLIGATTAAESLPDPTTVAQRTHLLVNNGAVTTVWSSVGATPFNENGVLVATISVAPGNFKLIQSDGTHWIETDRSMVVGPGNLQQGTATTGGGGTFTVNFAVAFSSVPVINLTVVNTGSTGMYADLTAVSTTSFSAKVWNNPVLLVLGATSVAAGSGVVVHWQAQGN